MRKTINSLLLFLLLSANVLKADTHEEDLGSISSYNNTFHASSGWQTYKFSFKAKESGRYTISVNASRALIKMKAGTSKWHQEFFRDANGDKSKREKSIELNSGQNVYLTVWKEEGRSLDFTLGISSPNSDNDNSNDDSVQKPFSCDSAGTIISYVTSGSASEGDSYLNQISLKDGKTISHATLDNTKIIGVNSIGYNVNDDYIWGYNIPKRKIVRIDANKNVKFYEMDNAPDIDGAYYNAADVSKDGILYMKSDARKRRLDRVKLDGTKKVQHVLSSINLNQSLYAADFAFSPIDGKIYYVDYNDGWLKKISIIGNWGRIEKVGKKALKKVYTVIASFDKNGNFYFNDGKDIDKVVFNKDGSLTLYENFTRVNGITQGDGARCPNAEVKPISNLPTIDIGDVAIQEGDSGKKDMVFKLRLDKAYDKDIKLDIITKDLTAKTSDGDYDIYRLLNLTIKAGETSKDITIKVNGDTRVEPDEQFEVDVKQNGKVVAKATATIINDDISRFECNSNSYIFNSDGDDNFTAAISVDIANKDISVANPSFGDGHINAIGFNPVDGFIYGWDFDKASDNPKPHIVKVDGAFNVSKVDTTGLKIDGDIFYLGDVSKNGIYYMAKMTSLDEDGELREIYEIDLNNSKVLSKIKLRYKPSDSYILAADFAINPKDDQLYVVNSRDNNLYRINVVGKNKGKVERLGDIGDIGNVYSVYNFFDADGNFYFQVDADTSDNEKIYKIAISNPWSYADDLKAKAQFYGKINSVSSGDGARCALSHVSKKPLLTIADASVIEGSSGENYIEFNVTSDREIKDSDINIDYKLSNGSATDEDYIKLDARQVMKINTKLMKLRVGVVTDTKVEDDENFTIELLSSSDYGIIDGAKKATGIIINDDSGLTCQQNAWLIKDNSSDKMFELDIVNANIVKKHREPKLLNALGFNKIDNYLWAYNNHDRNETIIRIGKDKDGNYIQKIFGPILDTDGNHILPTNEPDKDLAAINVGDIDDKGRFYMMHAKDNSGSDKDRVYVIDLNSSSSTYLKVIDSYDIVAKDKDGNMHNLNIVDWAFHPKNGKLYSVSSKGKFYEIDPVSKSATVSSSGYIKNIDYNNGQYETFFDDKGYLYIYNAKKTGKIYRIDLTNPDNPNPDAVLFSHTDPDGSGGDSARCANAPMGDKPILMISDASVVEGTGDENVTYMEFNVTSDRKLNSDISLDFAISNIDTSDDDYYKVEAQVMSSGKKSMTLRVGIVRDNIPEKDEKFSIELKPSSDYRVVEGEKEAVGTIIDDDYSKLVAFDVGDLQNKKIKTKVVNNPFDLEFAKLKSGETNRYSTINDDVNRTKYAIVDSSNCTNSVAELNRSITWSSFNLPKRGEQKVRISFNDNNNNLIGKAMKTAKVQLYWYDNLKKKYRASCSDAFAIRPDKFKIDLLDTIKAGNEFNITISALDKKEKSTIDYDEDSSALNIDINDTNPAKCKFEEDFNLGSFAFVDGNSTIENKKYNDVGKIYINVTEKADGSEFAAVDRDDTSADERLIGGDAKTITIRPDHFKVTSAFANIYALSGGDYYAIYSNDADSSPTWKIKIEAQNKDNQPTKNYNKECMRALRGNVPLSFSPDTNTTGQMRELGAFPDATSDTDRLQVWRGESDSSISYGGSSDTFSSMLSSDDFDENATANKKISFNFGRNSMVAKSPITLNFNSITVADGDVNGTDSPGKSVQYRYLRAYIEPVLEVVGKKELDAKVYYEAYDIGVGASSVSGESGWRIINYDSSVPQMFFSIKSVKYGNNGERIKAENISDETLKVTAKKVPERNSIKLGVDDDLLYVTYPKTKVSFLPDSANWAGKGNAGRTIDNNISRRTFRRIDW